MMATSSASSTPTSYSADNKLYLYTSLTAGSSHIITATSRLETILKANKIPFLAIDVATDEKARMLWGRRSGGKKLPGLVRGGEVVGDMEMIEDWNEYGELRENVDPQSVVRAAPLPAAAPVTTPTKQPSESVAQAGTTLKQEVTPEPKPVPAPSTKSISNSDTVRDEAKSREEPASVQQPTLAMTMKSLGEEAAKKAADSKRKLLPTKSTGESTTAAEITKAPKESQPAVEQLPATEASGNSTSEKSVESEATESTRKSDRATTGELVQERITDDTALKTSTEAGKTEASAATPLPSEVERVLDDSAAIPPPSGTIEPPSAESVPPLAASTDTASSDQAKAEEPSTPVATKPNLGAEALSSSTESAIGPSPSDSRSSLPLSEVLVPIVQHRGSNVSVASAEEIREIEQSSAIPEAEEEEEEDDEEVRHDTYGAGSKSKDPQAEHPDAQSERGAKTGSTGEAAMPLNKDGVEDKESSEVAKESTTLAGEVDAKKRTQDQPSASGDLAGQSVED
ncbi:MAG: hypothetical protein M1825_006132 [Sarcosagium campestre]|nr:MAG: hypothetical protein M1825_006132 [Sarcosagium campestre]